MSKVQSQAAEMILVDKQAMTELIQNLRDAIAVNDADIAKKDAQISGMKKALEKIIALGHYTGREIAEQALKEFGGDEK